MGLFQQLRAGPALPKENIRYRSGKLEITGLMCRPAGEGSFPIIAVNHGGFDPATSVGGLVHMFAKLGYIAVASDYRGTGGSEGRHEIAAGEVDDVLAAIDFARKLPNADGNRAVTMGISHGGCIALLAAARGEGLAGVVDLVGPTDKRAWWNHVLAHRATSEGCRRIAETLGKVDGIDGWGEAEWGRRSPIRVADRIRCPVFMVYGGADDMVPAEQGERMAAALTAAGNQPRLIIDPTAGHYFDAGVWDRIGREMIDFLNRCVGLPPLPIGL